MLFILQIGNVGDYGLRVYNPSSRQHCILPVEVSLNGASFLITVGNEAEQPPYRIENRYARLMKWSFTLALGQQFHLSCPWG